MISLGSYVLIHGGTRIFQEWNVQLCQMLQETSEETYLPNITYQTRSEDLNIETWITKKAVDIIPLGSYVTATKDMKMDLEDMSTYEMILARQASDENEVDAQGNLIKEEQPVIQEATSPEKVDMDLEKLKDFDYLVNNFYIVDSSTMTDQEQLNAEALLNYDVHLNQESSGPKVLIYHTHSQETFVDSISGDTATSIVGVGAYLTQLLNETYGIETMHHEGIYDMEDGKLDRSKAYQRAKPDIQKILAEHPSIEVAIDLHRDGVGADTHLVSQIDGKQTAQIMFFNGLSKTRTNGNIIYLNNPYIQDNLAMSLQMKLACESMYPEFTRKIYLKGYRYNMDMLPKTLLIEAGAQTNTVEEIRNAMEPLAKVLHHVLTE